MIKTEAMQAAPENDAELVAESLNGSQEAFRKIVERYQTLICSLAYCATGNVGQSEDLAQETFVAAWEELPELREPPKLRSWLCAILRFRISKQFRRQTREPIHAAESLDGEDRRAAPEAAPSDQAISHEEQAILWRSLERVPETYREPLVLFYREHQSVEAVAEKLGLSQDAVKQRLSRGRKMLQEEVLEFVTGALARTNPGQAFTLGVLATLPVTLASSAKAAALAGAAAKGGAAATGKGFVSVVLGVLAGPMLGFLFGFLGWREHLKVTRTPRERASIKRFGILILFFAILFFVGYSLYSGYLAPRFWKTHPMLVVGLGWLIMMSWTVFTFTFSWRHNRTMRQLREEERHCHPELFQDELPAEEFEYRSRATLFGLPLIHWRPWRMRRAGETIQPAIGWIASGERAYGILYASGGIAVGAISIGGVSLGLFAFGGLSIGLVALGGLAVGAVALGGGAIGWIASGGLALGWHAALGGVAAAHELALGAAALANHVNDATAREFFQTYRWFDFTRSRPRNLFWILCFGPLFVQMLIWIWWRRRMTKRSKRPDRPTHKYTTLMVAIALFYSITASAGPLSDRITVTVRGKGQDVLLIPGLASSGAVWDATLRRFEKQHRFHVIQVAGFAGLPARGNANGAVLQPTVDAIHAYVKSNHLKTPRVIGHSLGGLMGMMLAAQHGEDVGKLMVVESLPFYSVLFGATNAAAAGSRAAAMRDLILRESQNDYAQREREFLRILVKSPEGRKAAIEWAIASEKSVVARAMYENMTTDLRSALGEIKIPVMVLYAWDVSSGFPRTATDKLYRENFAPLPDKTLVRIDDSYHFIMLDQPDAFAKQVDAFLK